MPCIIFRRTIMAASLILVLSEASMNAGLVGYWKFDLPDDVGKAETGADLQAFGDATYSQAGQKNGALCLDGEGDFLAINDRFPIPEGVPIGNQSYTIMAWILPHNLPGNYGIVGWGNYYSEGEVNAVRTDGESTGLINYGWGTRFDARSHAIDDLYDGHWHHVCASYDSKSGIKTIYFDGKAISNTTVQELNVGSANFRIGTAMNYEAFQGLIDEVKIFDEALQDASISDEFKK